MQTKILTAKSSGKAYRVLSDCTLKGEPAYAVVGQRNGKDFGPVRWMKVSSFTAYS